MAAALQRPTFAPPPKLIPAPIAASPLTLKVIEVLNTAIQENKTFLDVYSVNFGERINDIDLGEILTTLQNQRHITVFYRYPFAQRYHIHF